MTTSELARALRIMLGIAACFAAADTRAADGGPPLDFVEGAYSIVGRGPDGGVAYAGSATIELDGDTLRLKRRVDGKEIAAEGKAESASPGEGGVLRFRWQDPEPATMTCLVGSDLDNYARLTCLWHADGAHPAQPGLEAMFPTGAWDLPETED